MILSDGTVIPPMTRAQAEAKIVERFKTKQQYGLYSNAIAHKTAGGTCCLIVYFFHADVGFKWTPILLVSDSCWEGAWYRYDREEAYEEYAARDADWAKREALCLKLLNPQPEPSPWGAWKQWWKGLWST